MVSFRQRVGGVPVGSADLHRGLAGLPAAHRDRPARPRRRGAVRPRMRGLTARTDDRRPGGPSVCPYCAVGCGQRVFVKDGKVTQIEGDPDCPISRGRLCPKGSASKSLVTSPPRQTKVRYRRPYGTEWEDLDLDTAMDMIADRVLDTRDEHLAGRRRPGPARCTARWASPASEGRPSTTRRTTSSRSCSRRWARSRSRTRRVFDTPPPSPVWGPRSAVAAPRTSSRTWPTLTASSSRAPTWPRPPGRVPVGDGGQGARRDGHPRRPAVHPDLRGGRPARAAPGRAPTSRSSAAPSTTSWRTSWYFRGLRRRLHQRGDDPARGLPGHRGPRRAVLRLRPRDAAPTTRRLAGTTRTAPCASDGRTA